MAGGDATNATVTSVFGISLPSRTGVAQIGGNPGTSLGIVVSTLALWLATNPIPPVGQFCYESDTGVVRIGDGVTAFASLSSGTRYAKQTAQTTSAAVASFVDIPGLAFSVQSGHSYRFDMDLLYQSDTATTGLCLAATTPAQTWGGWTTTVQFGGSGSDAFFEQTGTASFGSTTIAPSVVAPATTYVARAHGIMKPSADGTVQFRARTEVDLSTITVLVGGLATCVDLG